MKNITSQAVVPTIATNRRKKELHRCFLETLESRLFLSAYKWQGGTGNRWNTSANWIDLATGDTATNFPNAADATVTIPSTAEIHLTQDTTIGSLTIQGDISVTLVFDGANATNTTLIIAPLGTSGAVIGQLKFTQNANQTSALTPQTGTASHGTLHVDSAFTAGEATGQSSLTLDSQIDLVATHGIQNAG